jgi:hypothetical protein
MKQTRFSNLYNRLKIVFINYIIPIFCLFVFFMFLLLHRHILFIFLLPFSLIIMMFFKDHLGFVLIYFFIKYFLFLGFWVCVFLHIDLAVDSDYTVELYQACLFLYQFNFGYFGIVYSPSILISLSHVYFFFFLVSVFFLDSMNNDDRDFYIIMFLFFVFLIIRIIFVFFDTGGAVFFIIDTFNWEMVIIIH